MNAARTLFALALVAFLAVAPSALVNVSGMEHARAATLDPGTLAVVGGLALALLVSYANYARKALR